MSNPMTIGQLYSGKMQPGVMQRDRQKTANPSVQPNGTFKELLDQKLLKFSNHASKRLEQRGIEIKGEQLSQIHSAIEKAAAKGSKESLILMNNMALIVNIPNRTVVTAMDDQSMKNNVFTQIDSAVIIS